MVLDWIGVRGPADDGAVGKYSESASEDGVRHMDGRGESGGEGKIVETSSTPRDDLYGGRELVLSFSRRAMFFS